MSLSTAARNGLIALTLALVTLCPQAVRAERASPPGPNVSIRLVPEFSHATPGEKLTIAIEQTIQPNWHTYWANPGDSGEAMKITWTLPDGVTASDLEWPVPERIPFGPLLNFGYNNRAIMLSGITADADYKNAEIPVKADITWLVCADICIPEKTTIALSIPVSATTADKAPADPAFFEEARARIANPVAWKTAAAEREGAIIIDVDAPPETRAQIDAATEISFFPDEWGVILNAEPQIREPHDSLIRLKIPRDSRALSDLENITGILSWTSPDGQTTGVRIAAEIKPAAAGMVQIDAMESPARAPETGFIGAVIFAVLGGLILNLMPCVFPVLSMKALSLVKLSDRDRSDARALGLYYLAGILTCFLGVAGLLIVLKQSGLAIGWGFQLQHPAVILILSYLLFVIGLNLSGLFDITPGRLSNLGQNLANGHGHRASFFAGMLATIVATPCTAPFMGVALGYALTQGPGIALAVFFALGFGLALPYLVLCFVPALQKKLPRPGAWMETFRNVLAFPMFASSGWLVWVLAQQIDAINLLWPVTGFTLIALLIWLWKKTPDTGRAHVTLRLFAAVIAAVLLAILFSTATQQQRAAQPGAEKLSAKTGAIPFDLKIYEDLLRGDDPVFVDMTAAWCITCKVNERVALDRDETRALFDRNKVSYIVGDWTNRNPDITDYLMRYGRNGVPIYVFYGARDPSTGKRPDPVVLPQILTPGIVAAAVERH